MLNGFFVCSFVFGLKYSTVPTNFLVYIVTVTAYNNKKNWIFQGCHASPYWTVRLKFKNSSFVCVWCVQLESAKLQSLFSILR